MRGVTALVTVMTTLILLGLALFAYGIATKTGMRESLKEIALPRVGSIQLISPWKNGVALYVVSPEGDAFYFVDPERKDPLRVPVNRK